MRSNMDNTKTNAANANAAHALEEIKRILSVESDINMQTYIFLDSLKTSRSQSTNLLNGLSANVVMDNLKTELLLNTLISNFGGVGKVPEIYKGLDSDAIMDDLISKFC